MPSLTASGPIAVAVEGLRTLIANLPYFQTWTGEVDATGALTHVHGGEVGVPIASISVAAGGAATITTARPHGLIMGDDVTMEGASIGAESELDIAGTITPSSIPTTTTFVISTAVDEGEYEPKMAFVLRGQRPFAIVAESSDAPVKGNSVGTGGSSVLSGSLDILVEALTSDLYLDDAVQAPMEARNAAGTFLQQLIQYQGTGDFMLLNSVEMVSLDFLSTNEQDDNAVRFERWRAVFRCTWGLEG